MGGQRDNQIVNESGDYEHQQAGPGDTDLFVQRTKNQIMCQLAKAKVPPLPPKFTECFREDGLGHDRLCDNAVTLPEKSQKMKTTEVQ